MRATVPPLRAHRAAPPPPLRRNYGTIDSRGFFSSFNDRLTYTRVPESIRVFTCLLRISVFPLSRARRKRRADDWPVDTFVSRRDAEYGNLAAVRGMTVRTVVAIGLADFTADCSVDDRRDIALLPFFTFSSLLFSLFRCAYLARIASY